MYIHWGRRAGFFFFGGGGGERGRVFVKEVMHGGVAYSTVSLFSIVLFKKRRYICMVAYIYISAAQNHMPEAFLNGSRIH